MYKIISSLLLSLTLSVSAADYNLSTTDTLMTSEKLSEFVNQVNSKQVVFIKYSTRFGEELRLFLNNNPDYLEKVVILAEQRLSNKDIELKNNFPEIVFTSSFIREFNSLMNNPDFLESNIYNADKLIAALSRVNFAFYEQAMNNSCYKTYPNDEDLYISSREINKTGLGCSLHYIKH